MKLMHSCNDSSSVPSLVVLSLVHQTEDALAELFNKCLKESCFPDCWKLSLVVPVSKNVGETSTAKTPTLWLVKSLKNL